MNATRQFWIKQDFDISKVDKEVKNFSGERELKKIQKAYKLSSEFCNEVKIKFNNFERRLDKLNFKYFLKFFKGHKEAIRFYYNKLRQNDMIKLLFDSYKNSLNDFFEIHDYNLWLKEGKGYAYDINIDTNLIKKLSNEKRGSFNPRIKNSMKKYSEMKRIFFDENNFLLLVLSKGSKNKLYIGIRIFKGYSKLFLSNKFSAKERHYFLKIAIKKGILLDTLPKKINYDKFINFIKDPDSIKDPILDLISISFEKNGVLFSLEEVEGTPENAVNMELNSYKKDLTFDKIKSVGFYYQKDSKIKKNYFKINNYDGIINFSFNSYKKGKLDYLEALDNFKSQFGFLPDKSYSDLVQNKKKWYSRFLDHNRAVNYKGFELPMEAIEVIGNLKNKNLILDPKKGAFAYVCFSNCPGYGKQIWGLEKIDCQDCGERMCLIKEELSYEKSIIGIKKYIKNLITKHWNKKYRYFYFSKKLFNKKIDLIKIFDENNDSITLCFSNNKKDFKYFNELSERSSNLMIFECGTEVDNIIEPIYRIKLSDFIYEIEENKGKRDFFKEAIKNQKSVWKERKIICANKSLINLIRIHNKKDLRYKGFQYEKDCFNSLNSFFDNCVWLGSKDSGGKVPDGAIELKELDGKKGCIIWDTKLSSGKKKASVGSVKKNKTYINNFWKNKIIKDFGGLKSYIIISNDLSEVNFNKIFTKIKKDYKGKKKTINYLFLDSRLLVKIYEFIKENQKHFDTDESLRKDFFSDINNLFGGNYLEEGVGKIKEGDIKKIINKYKNQKKKTLLEEVGSFRGKNGK